MKKFNLLFVAFLLGFLSTAQAQWTNKTMSIGGLTRSYRIYVSPNYSASDPASIVITLHGLGDNMTNFSGLGFNYIADTANIIVLVPQAVSDVYAGAAWNSGAGVSGYYPNASVNDIGFINALVDTTVAHYAVDQSSVYLTGFSMGGFMTHRMAIQSNAKFAAFASMSGTIGAGITGFTPGRIVPMAHFHGTADQTVAFSGNQYGLDPDSVVSLWVSNNLCDLTPDTVHFADAVPGDSITVDMYRYTGTAAASEVRFYVMNNCTHTVLFEPDNDITEIIEIWNFFRQHKNLTAGTDLTGELAPALRFFPNPASDYITLISSGKGSIEVYDMTGKVLQQALLQETSQILDIRGLQAGVYFLRTVSDGQTSVEKLIVR